MGHAYSALLNADFARRFGGRFLLRIEDIDMARCRPEFEAAIYEDLAWLGLVWESPVRRQSEHFSDYRAAFRKLKERGAVYPCFCSRKDIATAIACREVETGKPSPRDPDGTPLYPGLCASLPGEEAERRIQAGEPHAWRLDGGRLKSILPGSYHYRRFDRDGREETVAADPWRWGDAVIVRKEIPTSYHLSVVLDDAVQGITHVVRGQDLEAATDLHVLLQALLSLPTPLYHHHGLVLDPTGDKLAKSRQSTSLAEARAAGMDPQDIRRRLGL